MTDPNHRLSLTRQAGLLGISRGSLYYKPRPTSDADLKLMRRIDQLHMEYPFAGSRMMKGLLRQEGFTAGRLHVATCMKTMGIEALYRRPNTAKPAPGHKIYPYLLRKLPVTRPNQVWAMDITYIPNCPRVRLSGRRSGLVQPQSSGLAAVSDPGNRTLPGGAERGYPPVREA